VSCQTGCVCVCTEREIKDRERGRRQTDRGRDTERGKRQRERENHREMRFIVKRERENPFEKYDCASTHTQKHIHTLVHTHTHTHTPSASCNGLPVCLSHTIVVSLWFVMPILTISLLLHLNCCITDSMHESTELRMSMGFCWTHLEAHIIHIYYIAVNRYNEKGETQRKNTKTEKHRERNRQRKREREREERYYIQT